MKNWRKHLSPLLSSVMLLSTVGQTAVPLVAYAETATDDSLVETTDVEETNNEAVTVASANLITTADELINFIDTLVTIEQVEITEERVNESSVIYTALTENGVEFSIFDKDQTLSIEVADTYASITGQVIETEEGAYQIAPDSAEDLILAVSEEEPLPEAEVAEDTDAVEAEEPGEEGADSEVENEGELEGEDTQADLGEEEAENFSTFQALQEEVETLQAPTFDLSLMHMNDTHARVPNYANMVTAINTYRSANPNSILLHAGDVFSGTLYFNEFEGQADLALLNLMGIDAFAFGNHEFDLGGSPDGHASLANFVRDANFPFLGTNINFSADPNMAPFETNGTLVENPAAGQIYNSIILNVDGEQVGVFGLTTEDTANIASPGSIAFSNYIAAAEQAVAEFEAAGINKIVALTHIGYASTPAVGNDIILANQVDGIDVIVGGHSHTALATPDVVDSGESPTVIVQAGANADNLGTLQVTFNDAGEIIAHEGALLPVADYEPDATALAALAPYQEAVDTINNTDTGAVAVRELENPRHGDGFDVSVRANETPLGNLVTDAMLAKTRELYPETVIAFQNGGGIRAPIDAGPITVGEVIQVLPFGNNPVVVDLTGYEILELMELSLRANQRPGGGLEENGGFLHVSGMVYYFDSERPIGNRVIAMFIEEDDGTLTPINLNDSYLVTTNAFTGQGGDGLTPFARAYAEGRVQDTGAIDWEQLRDYMVQEEYLGGVVDPVVENRSNNLQGDTIPEEIAASALELRIGRLERALDNLEAEQANLIEEINDIRELLASLKAALEAGETGISELDQRLQDLEARVAALEAGIDEEEPGEEEPGEEEPGEEEPGEEEPGKEEPNEEPEPAEPTVPTVPGDSDDDDTDTSGTPREESKKDKDGKPLPATGAYTNDSTLYIGFTVLISGAVLYVISKRKRA